MIQYEAAEKAEIQRVATVFHDLIQKSPFMDFIWLDKLGYLFLALSSKEVQEAVPIERAEQLCSAIIKEISYQVTSRSEENHNAEEITAAERAEIRSILAPCMDQLPEYQVIQKKFLKRSIAASMEKKLERLALSDALRIMDAMKNGKIPEKLLNEFLELDPDAPNVDDILMSMMELLENS